MKHSCRFTYRHCHKTLLDMDLSFCKTESFVLVDNTVDVDEKVWVVVLGTDQVLVQFGMMLEPPRSAL